MSLAARDPRAPFQLTSPLIALDRRPRRYDYPLLASALLLALAGGVLVWAATRSAQIAVGADPQAYFYRHLINIAVAAALMVAASRLDARLLRLFGPIVYLASLLGLLLVMVAGTTINGAHAWIRLGGGVEVQPSEFTKLGLIVGMAVLFTRHAEERYEDAPPTTGEVLVALGCQQPRVNARVVQQQVERPRQPGGGGLVAGHEQGEELVADLAVGQPATLLISCEQQRREDVVALG